MSFLKTVVRASKCAACAATMTFLTVSSADAQTTTIINDSFANGFSDLSGTGSEMNFFTTSSSLGLNADPTVPGPIEFASGSSGRAIHGLFPEQTLAAVGDALEMTFDFTTPATLGSPFNNEDFRWGLFSTSGAPGGQADFAMTTDSSSGTPNPLLELLAGFEGEIDNLNAAGTDLGLRTHNVNAHLNSSASTSGQSPDGTPSGILMNTTGGFDFISGGPDDEITILGSTAYTGRLFLELTDPTMDTLSVTIEILDGAGTVMSTHTDDLFVNDQFDPATGFANEIGVNTLSFDFLGISVTSGAFGSSSLIGDPDNGLSISNVTINFTQGSTALLGDSNVDGMVNFLDISPFITILLDNSAGSAQAVTNSDINGDGVVNFLDIALFITVLANA